MCEKMNIDIGNLLYYTHVRWLSKGKVLNIDYSHKDYYLLYIDIIIFLREQNIIELTMKWEENEGIKLIFQMN